MFFGVLLISASLLSLMLMFSLARRKRRMMMAYAGRGGRCGSPDWRERGERWRSEAGARRSGSERRPRWRDGAGWMRAAATRRLKLDEHQAEVLQAATRQASRAVSTFTDIVKDSRDELADAVKGETLDDVRLDAVFEKWDESMLEARKDLVDATRRLHAALEPEQRRRLAEWIELVGE